MKIPYKCISDFIFVEEKLDKADVILVPGCNKLQVIEGAVNLYKEGFAPYILPSGGKTKGLLGFESEWEMLKERAVELGVPDKAILKEDQAMNTFENAKYSLKVLETLGIGFDKVILSCKWVHSRRALLTYETIFPKNVKFYVAPVLDENKIHKDNWYYDENQVNEVMTEVVKIGRYFSTEVEKWMNREY